MPLTAKGEKIKEALTKEYGEKKGEQVLYAGKNKGTFTGIDSAKMDALCDAVATLGSRVDAMETKRDAQIRAVAGTYHVLVKFETTNGVIRGVSGVYKASSRNAAVDEAIKYVKGTNKDFKNLVYAQPYSSS